MEEELTCLTKEMVKEEGEMEEINKEEGEKMRTKMEEKAAMENEQSEQRHKRLMHLLTKSEFYSRYLLKKIHEEKESDNNNNRKKRLKTENEDKENSGSSNSSSQESSSSRPRKIRQKTSSIINENIPSSIKVEEASANTKENSNKREIQPVLLENGTMRSYQLEGFGWLKTLFENGVNGILADEMGLGKTIQSIAMICHLIHKGIAGPYLIVAPLSTLSNWISEFKRFAPKIPVMLYHGTKEVRKERRETMAKRIKLRGTNLRCYPIVITSYEVAIRDTRELKQIMWRYLAVDEGHRLKNHKCLLAKSLCMIKSTNRVILTGTPLQNNLAELWSLLNFLLPDIFDNLDVFESWFEIEDMMEEGADEKIVQQEREKQIISTLHKILNPFLLRRVKADIDLEIPPKKELHVFVPLTQLQLDLYQATITRDFSAFKDIGKSEPKCAEDEKGKPKRRNKQRYNLSVLLNESETNESFEEYLKEAVKDPVEEQKKSIVQQLKTSEVYLNMRNVMMQCRRIVNHPFLLQYPLTADGQYKIDDELLKQCGKLQVLDQLLVELQARGHKVLLFSQMTKLLDIIEDYLTLRPQFKYKRLDGNVKLEDRASDISEFNEGHDHFLFILSTRAGGLGINLTSADTVIIYDSDWNPQQDLQAQDRCHRIGQTRPVLVLRLVAAATVDERIVARAAAKRKLERAVMRAGQFRSGAYEDRSSEQEGIDPGELLRLLQTRDHNRVHKASSGSGILTKEELNQVLDRSDLTKSSKDVKSELKGVFKKVHTPGGS